MSEEQSVAAEVTGVETTMPTTTPPVEATPTEFSSIIPAEYADKPWVQDIKDVETMFKMTDDLKSELGKRPAGIPQEDGDWTEFNKAFGVPETVEGYELSAPAEGGEDFQKAMKDAALKLGMNQKQLSGMDEAFNKYGGNSEVDVEAQNVEFDKMVAETFGDRQEEVLKIAKGLIDAHTPDSFKADIDGLSNKHLTIMAAVLDGVQQKYISEDDLPKGEGQVPSGVSAQEKRAKGLALMSLPEYSDKSHPNHKNVLAQVDAIYRG